MARELVIRGVPRALEIDMWWLASETDIAPSPAPEHREWGRAERHGRPLAALAVLVMLADVLFYGHAPGLSLAVFAAAALAAAMMLNPAREQLQPTMLLAVASLPVIEYVQPLSVAFLMIGLLVSLAWTSGGAGAIGRRTWQLAGEIPLRGLLDGVAVGVGLARSDLIQDRRQHAKAWAFPLGGALILMALLVLANPLLDDALSRLLSFDPSSGVVANRLLFWAGSALLIWPLIAPLRTTETSAAPYPGLRLPGPSGQSVARGLVLFNAILAVQTGLDVLYLWGGAELPPGMTAAEYAHRGAYPLLVTALLAGAFALTARPFARQDKTLRVLLILWLAQNLALTVSALLRLELYVEAFGLTYLRLHSAIWMAVVAAGLGLMAWQVWRDLPNRWLLVRSAALGVGVLYVACFVNFAAIIATENLSRAKVDGTYVCALGPTAAASIAVSGQELRVVSEYGDDMGKCPIIGPQIMDWRDWGFRNWRVSRYLASMPVPERT